MAYCVIIYVSLNCFYFRWFVWNFIFFCRTYQIGLGLIPQILHPVALTQLCYIIHQNYISQNLNDAYKLR